MHKEHDYNLLKVLVLIYEHRSLTTAAAKLGKTESAVSKHLAKLRDQLGDPLFIRRSSGLEPTHYLERIMPGIQRGLRSVENALKQGAVFDAPQYEHPIVIALDNVSIECFGTQILSALRAVFQNSLIELTTWRPCQVIKQEEKLDDGFSNRRWGHRWSCIVVRSCAADCHSNRRLSLHNVLCVQQFHNGVSFIFIQNS